MKRALLERSGKSEEVAVLCAGSGGFRRYVPLQNDTSAGLIGKATTSNATPPAPGALA